MSRASRLWKAAQRRVRYSARLNTADSVCMAWLVFTDDMQDLALMPFVRNARSWKRVPLWRIR